MEGRREVGEEEVRNRGVKVDKSVHISYTSFAEAVCQSCR